jgi:hypothetical protein
MIRDDLDDRLGLWLQDGPERASRERVDATFAPLGRMPQRSGVVIRLARPAPARRVVGLFVAATLLIILATAALLAAGGAPRPPQPTAPAAATFRIVTGPPDNLVYVDSPTPASSDCRTPATGPWAFEYTALAFGSTPFLMLSVSIPLGAATPPDSHDFRISIGDSLFIDELGRLSGSHDSRGTVTITREANSTTIHIDGVAARPGSDTTLTSLTLDLTCPD